VLLVSPSTKDSASQLPTLVLEPSSETPTDNARDALLNAILAFLLNLAALALKATTSTDSIVS